MRSRPRYANSILIYRSNVGFVAGAKLLIQSLTDGLHLAAEKSGEEFHAVSVTRSGGDIAVTLSIRR
jgi:hypothetical protein